MPVVICTPENGEQIETEKGSDESDVAEYEHGNKLLGGEGFFNTKVTGPGRVWIQTMPRSQMASSLAPFTVASK